MPALICGNSIIFKPSSDTPLCAIELVKKFSREPHKFPEPITLAHKFLNGVKGEFEKGTRKE